MPLRRGAAALAVAAGVLTACADDGPQPVSPTLSSPGLPPASTATAGTPTPTAPDFTIDFRGGKIGGDTGRLKVERGAVVTIEVTSDVVEELHLHGYDLRVPLQPGAPSRVTFTANVPGVFELELEGSHRRLASVQVQ